MILIGAGSGAVALVVMAHFGILAAMVASIAVLRRRSRGRRPEARRPTEN
jgi:hypothetical protein